MRSIVLLAIVLSGCSVRSSDSSFETVQEMMGQRIPETLAWRSGVEEMKNQFLIQIQHEGLSQEKAIQLALVNNPDLFAYYENLEMGYADLLEAGLMQNPFFSTSVRFPSQSRYQLNNLFDAAMSFLDLFLIPLRKRAAEAEIQVIEAEVGQRVLDLVKEVQIGWLEVKAQELLFEQEKRRVDLREIAAGLAALQQRAGNISLLSARSYEIAFEEVREELKDVAANLQMAREKVNRLLGLFGEETLWHLVGEIDWKGDPELPECTEMERAALENRLDIEALRRKTRAIARAAKLKEWWTYSNLQLGVSSEMQPEGFTTTGPAIALQIPIFNYGQGEKKRFHARLEQAQKKLLAKAVQACSEVREFAKTSHQYRCQLEDWEERILPDLNRQLISGQEHYNVMTLGPYVLIDMLEEKIQAVIDQLHAALLYKKARIELLHAAGGTFSFTKEAE